MFVHSFLFVCFLFIYLLYHFIMPICSFGHLDILVISTPPSLAAKRSWSFWTQLEYIVDGKLLARWGHIGNFIVFIHEFSNSFYFASISWRVGGCSWKVELCEGMCFEASDLLKNKTHAHTHTLYCDVLVVSWSTWSALGRCQHKVHRCSTRSFKMLAGLKFNRRQLHTVGVNKCLNR